jgi:hypothetical protein
MTTRREAMRTALIAGAYSAPALLSIGTAQEVAAMSPAPSSALVVITQSGTAPTIRYNLAFSGLLPNMPYVVLFAKASESRSGTDNPTRVINVITDANGAIATSVLSGAPSYQTGTFPLSVNGGVLAFFAAL